MSSSHQLIIISSSLFPIKIKTTIEDKWNI